MDAQKNRIPPGNSLLQVDCPYIQYSAGTIARAIEDTDTQLLQLTCCRDDDDTAHITLIIDAPSPHAAARSLLRYGYNVTDTQSPTPTDRERELINERIAELNRYLNI